MIVQAEVSLYPLRSPDLSVPIGTFCEMLRRPDVHAQVGTMSTALSGQSREVFDTLRRALEAVGAHHEVVLVLKVSNACPATAENPATVDLPS